MSEMQVLTRRLCPGCSGTKEITRTQMEPYPDGGEVPMAVADLCPDCDPGGYIETWRPVNEVMK